MSDLSELAGKAQAGDAGDVDALIDALAAPGFMAARSETWDDGTIVEFGPVPFPQLDRKVDLPTGHQMNAASSASISLSALHATQREITKRGLDKTRDANEIPPLVVRSNGIYYIQDGHHRLSKQLFAGDKTADVRLIDLDGLKRPAYDGADDPLVAKPKGEIKPLPGGEAGTSIVADAASAPAPAEAALDYAFEEGLHPRNQWGQFAAGVGKSHAEHAAHHRRERERHERPTDEDAEVQGHRRTAAKTHRDAEEAHTLAHQYANSDLSEKAHRKSKIADTYGRIASSVAKQHATALDSVSRADLAELANATSSDADVDNLIDAMLAGVAEEPAKPNVPAIVDLRDPIGTLKSMMAHYDALPDAEKPTAGKYLRAATRYMNKPAIPITDEMRQLAKDLLDKLKDDVQSASYFDEFLRAGPAPYAIGDRIAEVDAEMQDQERKRAVVSKAHDDAAAPIIKAHNETMDGLYRRESTTYDMRLEPGRLEEAKAEHAKIRDEMAAERERFVKELEALPQRAALADLNEVAKRIAAGYTEIGMGYREQMLDSSPVTHEQAEKWAAAQNIEPHTKKKLASMGYTVERVRADMAQFYRLTRGRLGSVSIGSKRGSRAHADEIHGHGDSIIKIASDFNKRVLFHELAHHLEADPILLEAAKAFLQSRKNGDPVSMNKLAGGGYESHEKAYPDHFFSPYIGKVYPDATEVFSMGVESFSDPETLAKRMAKDSEMFSFIIGAIKSEPHPLWNVVKSLRKQAAEIAEMKAEATEDEYETLLAKYVADVTIEPGQSFGQDIATNYFIEGVGKWELIGGWNDTIFVQCSKLRNWETRRYGKGILILSRDGGERFTVSRQSHHGLDFAKGIAKSHNSLTWGDVDGIKRRMKDA